MTDAARRRWFRAAAALLAIVATLAAVEIAFRVVLGPRFRAGPAGQRPQDVLGRYDPDVGWALLPGRRTRILGDGVEYAVALDAHGFRNADDAPADPSRRRIALIGDSGGFGWGVDDGDSFAARLARDPRLGVSVTNLCVPGYSTDQELWTLEREGARVRPDLVLLAFCVNDLEGNESTLMHGMLKPRFVRSANGVWRIGNRPVARFIGVGTEPTPLPERVLSHTAFWQVVTGRTPLREPPRATPAAVSESLGAAARMGPDSPTRHAFELLAAECRALGAPLVAFGVYDPGEADATPTRDGGAEFLYAVNQALAALGRDVGFTTLSVDRALRDAWAQGRELCVPDKHLNAEGNRLVAEALVPQLAPILEALPRK